MYSVLAFLRTIIATGVAFVVWYIVAAALGWSESLTGVMVPLWSGGLVGGVVSSVFNPRQGIMLAFTCGILLTIGFLYYRHGMLGLAASGNTLITLWPLWWPLAFYLGAYGYIATLVRRK